MMKLRRRLSGVLSSKKLDPGLQFPTTNLSSISEVGNANDIPLVHDSTQIQQALIDSMYDQHEDLQRDLAKKDSEIARLQEQQYRGQREVDQHNDLFGVAIRLRRELDDTVASMTREKNAQAVEHERQLCEHRRQATEHLNTIREHQDIAASMSDENIDLRTQLMEVQLKNAELSHMSVNAQAQAVLNQAQAGQRTRVLDEMQASRDTLIERVRMLEAELAGVRVHAARKAEEYAEEAAAARATAWGGETTPRSILASMLLVKGFQATSGTDRPEVALFLRTCSLPTLTNQSMDVRLDQTQAQQFAGSIGEADGSLSFLRCSLCNLHKVSQIEGASSTSSRVDEFSTGTRPTPCCSQNVCTKCYLAGVVWSLYEDWWTRPQLTNWILCPVPYCNSRVLILGTPEDLLRRLGDGRITEHMDAYDRVSTLRAAFTRLFVDDDALEISHQIHRRLFQMDKMYSLSDNASHLTMQDHNNDLSALDPSRIEMLRVDRGGSSIEVPLLVNYLSRGSGRECAVCTEEIIDVDIGSPEDWVDGLCADFPGDWMWMVLLFPVRMRMPCRHESGFCRRGDVNTCQRDGEYCRHEMNICTGCLQRHLETQLEQHGRACCDRLTCPDCRRVLDYDEIKLYAKENTFQTYDKHLNLDYLSKDPTFRWCLRPDCGNGALYEYTGDPRIQCDECAFEMCREHCEPWHEGLTCDQHDSIKAHGDPDFQMTAEWIEQNTKPCPNCGRNIQKGEACFHMTCSQCRAEFCWVCLANWADIQPRPGEHNANAHGASCPFRTNGLTPSQLIGENITQAQRW